MSGEILQAIAAILMVAGSLFCLLAAIGVLRLPDLLTRMHAASKAGAVGTGLVFLSIALGSFDPAVMFRALIGIAFLILTTPLSAHLLARAAMKSGYRPVDLTDVSELESERKVEQ